MVKNKQNYIMKKKNPSCKPIYFENMETINLPLYELMKELRNDVAKVRGKLSDIRHIYGWEDRIQHLEGGLTCMLVAMHGIELEWKEFEERHGE